jgi:hypothetical protein
MIDHDRLFKELLTEFFGDFVDLFLPELAAYLDKASLVFLDKEIFTDVTSGATHEADLVVRARFCSQDSFFLVHLEHQAQAQRDFGRRMFRYFARLHDKHAMPVYPIVVFSHASNLPEPDHYEVAFPDLAVLQFRYRVIQLALMNWRDYLRRANPVASALIAKMGMAIEERPRVKLECLRLLATLRLNPARMRLISGFVDTRLRLNAQEMLIFREQTDTLEEKEKDKVMELTTSWKEEGIREGIREGSQQVVFRQLRRRWGELPPRMVARLQALPVQEIEDLAEALWDFTSLADVEKWLGGERTPPKL